MNKFVFDSKYQLLDKIEDSLDEHLIKNETMLHRCTRDYAWQNGGELTQRFLRSLPEGWDNVLIDSRCHMLFDGWLPCIPGWHHDDVPRTLPTGQPNYYNPHYFSEHIMCLFNGDLAPTEFAVGEAQFPDIEEGEHFYKKWHPIVDSYCQSGSLIKECAPSGQLIYFDWQTWHQGVPAVGKGWRMFIRATRNSKLQAKNEIRKQSNVYLPYPMEGW